MQGYLSRCQLHNATPGNIAETLAGGKMQQTPFPGEAWQFYSFRGCRLGAPPQKVVAKVWYCWGQVGNAKECMPGIPCYMICFTNNGIAKGTRKDNVMS